MFVLVFEEWESRAACAQADPDLFFPGENHPRAKAMLMYRQARLICAECPVKSDCLDFALRNNFEDGMWAGLSPVQLRKYRRALKQGDHSEVIQANA